MQVEDANVPKIGSCKICLVRLHIVYDGEERRVINYDFVWTVAQNRAYKVKQSPRGHRSLG